MKNLLRRNAGLFSIQLTIFIGALIGNVASAQMTNSPLSNPENSVSSKDLLKSAKLKSTWLEKISKESALLKLSENKALINAKLGNLYWKTDQTHARSLFNQAVVELVDAQKEAEADQKIGSSGFSYPLINTRRLVLQLIVKNDEALAFDSFTQSRPQAVSDALAGRPLPDSGGNAFSSDNLTPAQRLIQQENDIEQMLAMSVINLNQKRAIDILRRDSLETITTNTYQLLKSLRQKDPPAVGEIAVQIVHKILTIDLAKFPNGINFINQLLFDSLPENKSSGTLQISDADIHLLAEKEADFLIKSGRNSPGNSYEYALSIKPTLIKLLPTRADELNAIVFSSRNGFSFGWNFNRELIKNGTDEQIAVQAATYPPELRDFFYSSVANGIAASGDLERAKTLLAKNFTGKRLTDLYGSLYLIYIHQIIAKGDYEKAEKIIHEIDPKLQFSPTIELAVAINKKNPKDTEKVRLLLAQAHKMIPDAPTTREDFIKFDRLASAYALIDSKMGFRLLEMLIGKYIEIANASIVVDSFQAQGISVRDNEFLIGSSNLRLSIVNIQLKNFMSANPEKTQKLINQVKRSELRISLELQAIESAENINQLF